MTTDTDALQERIAQALYGARFAFRPGPRPTDNPLDYRDARAVLPIIAAEVQAASEKAWDDGESSGLTEAAGGHGWPNPYRATETGDRA